MIRSMMTGNFRYRRFPRLFKKTLLVVQLQVKCWRAIDGHEDKDHPWFKWIDATPNDLRKLFTSSHVKEINNNGRV